MTLCVSSGSVAISWDDEHLNEAFSRLFFPWQGQDPSPSHRIGIRRRGAEYLLTAPNSVHHCRDRADLFSRLEYTLTGLFQKIFEQNLLIHASCVDLDGRGILFVGPHGAGKTTLALTALSSGWRALTDDLAILGDDLQEVVGFPRPFKVAGDIWNISPAVVPRDCPFFECFDDLRYVHFYLPAWYYAERTRVRHVVFIDRGSRGTDIRELGETEALRRLLPQGFNFFSRKETIIGEVLDLLRAAPPLEMRFGDHWDAIGMVKELL